MKRSTAFFFGLIVLAIVVWKTTSWEGVRQWFSSMPIAGTANELVRSLTPTSSSEQVFSGDRSKPYTLRLQSGEGDTTLTWVLTMDDHVDGFAYDANHAYGVYGAVVTSTDQLVFSAYTTTADVPADATGTWRGQSFSGFVSIKGVTSTLRLVDAASVPSAATISFVKTDRRWSQASPTMGCEFALTMPVIQTGNGVSRAAADRMNAVIRDRYLKPAATMLDETPSTVSINTPEEARDRFLQTCRTQLNQELDAYKDDLSNVGGMFQRTIDISTNISHNQDGWLSFTSDIATYTGGAHGSNVRNTFVFNTKTGEEVGLAELIKPEKQALFGQRVARELLRQYKDELFDDSRQQIQKFANAAPAMAQTLWSRGESGISTSTSWYLIGHGMSLVFQQYEVTPYAAGLPEIYLPYSDWRELVQSEYNPFGAR